MNGRPPIYKSPEDLEQAITNYFSNVPTKKILAGKPPNQQMIDLPILTVTGLCLHLGFESRQSFYDYEKRDGFSYIIKKARLLIEKEYEEMLQVGNTVGAIFALKQFGWTDKREVEYSGTTKNITILKDDRCEPITD